MTPALSPAPPITGVSTIVARRFDPALAAVAERPFGSTIAEILDEELPGASAEHRARLMVVIVLEREEREISLALWAEYRPPSGATVRVHLRLAKGNIIRSLLSVAILVFAAWAGPLLFPALGGLGAGLIGAAGQFLLNALIPVEAPKGRAEEDPRYSLSGVRNQMKPYGKIPEVHGQIRIFPPLFAQPYTEGLGEDEWTRIPMLLGYPGCAYSDWKIGETELDKFPDAELQIETITPGGPWPLPGYRNPVFQDSVDTLLRYEEGFQVRETASNVDYLTVEFICKRGLVGYDKDGDAGYREVTGKIEYREKGTTVWIPVIDLVGSANTGNPYRFSHSWLAPKPGKWEVRCRRVEDEDQTNREFDELTFGALKGVRPVRPLNFNKPVVGAVLRIRSSAMASGSLNEISCIAQAVRPDWDVASQTWITRPTRSPAAALRRIAQGPANPEPAEDDDMDLAAYQELAEFCTAKNLSFDMTMDQDISVAEAMRMAARAGRAFPTRPEGLWSLFIDRPQAVRRGIVATRNASNFSGEPLYPDAPDAFRVAFLDEEDDWKKTERIVPKPGLVGAPKTFQLLDIPGVTNARQIWIEATRRHLEFVYRFETFNADQGAEHFFAPPGALLGAQFVTVAERQVSARVLEVADDLVILDEDVVMEAGLGYGCMFQSDDGVVFVRLVATRPGVWNMIEFAGDGPQPAAGNIALFGIAGFEAEDVVVKGVEPLKDDRARLTLVPHAPQIEAEAEASVPDWFPIEAEPRDWADQPPAKPEIVKVISGKPKFPDDVDFGDLDTPPVTVLVRPGKAGLAPTDTIRVTIGEYQDVTGAGVGRAEFDGDDFTVGSTITVTATAVSMFGVESLADADPVEHVVQAYEGRPTITSFTASRLTSSNRYAWASNDDEAVARIRTAPKAGAYVVDPPEFADMTKVHTGTLTASPHDAPAPSAPGVFWAGLILTNAKDRRSDVAYTTLIVPGVTGSDSFDRANGAVEATGGWTVRGAAGAGQVNGNIFHAASATRTAYSKDVGFPRMFSRGKTKFIVSNASFFLACRVVDQDNIGAVVRWISAGGGRWAIAKLVAGAFVDLTVAAQTTVPAADTIGELRVDADMVSFLVNGAQVIAPYPMGLTGNAAISGATEAGILVRSNESALLDAFECGVW